MKRKYINPPWGDTSEQFGQSFNLFQSMRTGFVIRHAEAMIHVIVDHLPLCRDNTALDGEQLLCRIKTGLFLLQHIDNVAKVPLGPLEALDDIGVGDVGV